MDLASEVDLACGKIVVDRFALFPLGFYFTSSRVCRSAKFFVYYA